MGDVETIVGSADTEFDKINVFAFIVLDGTDLVEDFVGELLGSVHAMQKSSTWRQRRIRWSL